MFYDEEFEVLYCLNLNVIFVLMEICWNLVNVKGEKIIFVIWDMNCFEEVCGVCLMVINGKFCQFCMVFIDQFEQLICLKLMKIFLVVCDLQVD